MIRIISAWPGAINKRLEQESSFDLLGQSTVSTRCRLMPMSAGVNEAGAR